MKLAENATLCYLTAMESTLSLVEKAVCVAADIEASPGID